MGGEHLQSINERELSGMIYAAVDVDTVEMQLFRVCITANVVCIPSRHFQSFT